MVALALGETGGELDVDLGAVVEHAQRPPRRIALDAIAELELLDVDANIGDHAPGDIGLGTLLLERQQLGGRVRPRYRRHVGRGGGAHLQVIGAPVGGDDQVGLQVGADRLHQDVDDGVLALAAGGVADHPSHGVAGGDGNEFLSRFERDVGDLIDGSIELVERPFGVGVDLDGIDVAVFHRLETRSGVRAGYTF